MDSSYNNLVIYIYLNIKTKLKDNSFVHIVDRDIYAKV